MSPLLEVSDPDDPRLRDFGSLTDSALRRRREPAEGIFIAEGEQVLRRALASGHAPRSLLLEPRWVEAIADLLDPLDVPVYLASPTLLRQLTGYRVHRGPLAALERKPLPDPAGLLADARRVLVLEDLVDTTNLGAVFRSAAAFGVDAVLLTPRCADPLYRRAVRVSMGAVFGIPYARFESWPGCFELVRRAGLRLIALTPAADATPIGTLPGADLVRCALMVGGEGPGLSAAALAAADRRVRIPMCAEMDSLNVAAAAAVALYAIGAGASSPPKPSTRGRQRER